MSMESAHENSKTNSVESAKEWYVLLGLSNRILDSASVKELYENGKVRIQGAYSREEILKYYRNKMVNSKTILFRDGDNEWKPFSYHDLTDSPKKLGIVAVKHAEKLGISWGAMKKRLALNKFVVITCGVVILAVTIGISYYRNRPEQIYSRVKKGVLLLSTEYSVGAPMKLGSGFVIDEDEGLLLTNFHVISELNSVSIKTGDNLSYEAEGVVYLDEKNDLAILKVRKTENQRLHGLKLGKPDELEVGEPVYAVGSPAGLEFTLSEGIVSGKRIIDPITHEKRPLIQITAPLSPGNSGGPVLDKKGRVVGVATLASKNELQNVNFAVPINLLGDYSKLKGLKYRFLSTKPEWVPLVIENDETQTEYKEGFEYRMNGASYDKKSITRLGSNRRVWVNAQMFFRIDYVPYNAEVLTLLEIDCTQKKFRYNMIIGRADENEPQVQEGFHDNDDWKVINDGDNALLTKVCESK